LPELEPQHTHLLEGLSAADRATQRTACDEAAAHLKRDPGFLPALMTLLSEGTPQARFAVAIVLFRSGRATLRLLPILLEALEFPDGDVRWTASHMLTLLGRMHGEVLPVVLHEARQAQSSSRRRMALYVLRELAPEQSATRAVVLERLEDPDANVRRAALSSLAKLNEPDSSCLERVIAILSHDPDLSMRRIAAVVLPDLVTRVPESRDRARAALAAAAHSTDTPLQRAAESALGRLGPS
jgi:HEAT repeat protein